MPTDAFRYWEYLTVFVGAGFINGFVLEFFGIDGGLVRVPPFLLLFPHFVTHVAAATSLAMGTASALVINILGAIGCMWNGWGTEGLPKWNLGFVDGMVFLAMLPGVVLASVWGARASLNLDRKLLKRLYAGFLAIIAVFMVYNLAI